MSEVRVIARSVARRGKENQLRELLRGMLAPTRTESGCKLYELYESDSNGRFYFYEIWESQAALDQHAASPSMRRPIPVKSFLLFSTIFFVPQHFRPAKPPLSPPFHPHSCVSDFRSVQAGVFSIH